jgi:hypothetical protein
MGMGMGMADSIRPKHRLLASLTPLSQTFSRLFNISIQNVLIDTNIDKDNAYRPIE